MSRRLPERLAGGLTGALVSFLTGGGLSVLILAALYGRADLGTAALAAAVTALAVSLLHVFLRRWSLAVYAAAAILLGLGCANIGPLRELAQGLRIFWVYGDLLSAALPPYREVLNIVLPVVMTALCGALVLMEIPGMALSFAAAASILLGSRLAGAVNAQALIGAGACIAGILTGIARDDTRLTLWPLLVALAAVALSALLMPRTLPETPALRETAEEVYRTIEEYLPASDDNTRSGFTLETEGFLPHGSDMSPRLGGPAHPDEEHAVMEVSTPYTLYLRGIPMNSYNGLIWEDTLSVRRYLYADLLTQNYRRQLFDEYLPLTNAQLTMDSATVHILSAGATTLFVPQRLRSLEMRAGHMTPYYNAGSEMFLTRELQAGDSYAFTYLRLPSDSPATASMVEAAQAVADTRYAEIAKTYTQLPAHMQHEVYALSTRAANGEETPYRRALAIRDYLREHYTYSLNVAEPPDNVDFATWFLFREQKGYCTYFATALAVLCRMQGIPARYVTGYLAMPDKNGYARVTSAHAHAWVEIYLNGFGWLTLDATPGHEQDDRDGDVPPPDDSNSTPTPSPAPPDDQPLDVVAPTPTSSPTPEPDLPEAQATEPPDEQPPEEPPAGPNLALLIALLLILLLAGCVVLYALMDPLRRARRHPRRAADILCTAMDKALALLIRPRRPDETLIAYYEMAARQLPDLPLREMAAAYSARVYGQKPIRTEPFEAAWEAMDEKLTPIQRLRVRLN